MVGFGLKDIFSVLGLLSEADLERDRVRHRTLAKFLDIVENAKGKSGLDRKDIIVILTYLQLLRATNKDIKGLYTPIDSLRKAIQSLSDSHATEEIPSRFSDILDSHGDELALLGGIVSFLEAKLGIHRLEKEDTNNITNSVSDNPEKSMRLT